MLELHSNETGNALAGDQNDVSLHAVLPKIRNSMQQEQYNNNNNDRLTAFDPGQPG